MDSNKDKQNNKPELPTKLEFEDTLDMAGMWFTAAALFAVIAAGIILYRTANDDTRTALNDVAPSAVSSTR
jgi:hypothetical protein